MYDNDAVERFIVEQYGSSVLNYYLKIDPIYGAARADLFRYLVIYKLGGVYLDLKSTFTQPISQAIRGDENYIISHWRNNKGESHDGFGYHDDLVTVGLKEYQQWHVIAVPGHPFLRAVIKAVLNNIDGYCPKRTGVGFIGVLRVTGPIAYTKAIAPIVSQFPCTVIANETVIGLKYSVLRGLSHQSLSKTHYTRNNSAIIRRVGIRYLVDSCYIKARNLKRLLQGRKY